MHRILYRCVSHTIPIKFKTVQPFASPVRVFFEFLSHRLEGVLNLTRGVWTIRFKKGQGPTVTFLPFLDREEGHRGKRYRLL